MAARSCTASPMDELRLVTDGVNQGVTDPAGQAQTRFRDVPPMRLRPEQDQDRPFLCDLYGTTRKQELDQVDWSPGQKRWFVEHQFSAQHSQYRQHYAQAAFLVIEQAAERIGRFYVHRTSSELRLMDVTLVPELRNRGFGTRLMRRLIEWSDELNLPVTLHVEPFNPAQRLYHRLGFETIEERGVHHFMSRGAYDRSIDLE